MSHMVISGNQRLIRNVNRVAILRALRADDGLSRADLSERLGLTRSAIGRLVDGLITDGWLEEGESVALGALGRRPTPLRLDESRLVLLGADINGERLRMVATSITGELHESLDQPTLGMDADAVVALLAAAVVRLVRKFRSARRRVCGLGIAVPGTVDAIAGVLRYSDSTGWRNLPVVQMLRERLKPVGCGGMPIVMERAVNCVVMQFAEAGPLPEQRALGYLHVGQKIAFAAVADGQLVRGRQGVAGSVGHQQVLPDGPPCTCGRQGCANAVLTLNWLQRELGVDAAGLEARLACDDETVRVALDRMSDALAGFLHNLVQVFDCSQLLLGGSAIQLGDAFFAGLQQRCSALGGRVSVNLQPVTLGPYSAAQGAASLMLNQLLDVRSEQQG